MRLIAVGCEYSGVSTLLDGLMAWGDERGIHHHLDDHFTIPDKQFLTPEDARAMIALTPTLKERFQRFQIVYHLRLIHKYEHILLGGFHIEEEVYGPLYYYPGKSTISVRQYEPEMPDDTILVHLKAAPQVIAARMQAEPHEHSLVRKQDIQTVLDRFHAGYHASWIQNKFEIDTSNLTPAALLQEFLDRSVAFLNPRDALTRLMEKRATRP
jgi:hypothetical protein